MILLSKSEWNLLGNCPESDLKDSRVDVMDVEEKDEIPQSQQYLVTTPTKIRSY